MKERTQQSLCNTFMVDILPVGNLIFLLVSCFVYSSLDSIMVTHGVLVYDCMHSVFTIDNYNSCILYNLLTSHWFSVRLNNICKNGKYQMTFSMITMMIDAEAEILSKLILFVGNKIVHAFFIYKIY